MITVIIAAYNAEKTIARAIDSVINDPNVSEIVVVDDASQDKTFEIACQYMDSRNKVLVLKQDENGGPACARNRAITVSSSPWITILDADDFILPGRMAGLLAFQDEADLIADDMWQVNEQDINGPKRLLIGDKLALPAKISFAQFVRSNVSDHQRERAELGFIKPLIRRQILEDNEIFYHESMRLGEDYELYCQALAHGARMILAPAQGYVSVVRSTSLSALHREKDLLLLRDCDLHLACIKNLSSDDKNALWEHYKSVDCRLQWRLLINAVKQRHVVAAIKTFLRPWPVPKFLAHQLFIQFQQRVLKKSL